MNEDKKQFLVTQFSVLDNRNFRKVMSSNKGIMLTWTWLRRHIVRAPMNTPYLKMVYEDYYMNGLLATTAPHNKLVKLLNISNKTFIRNVSILKNVGYLKVKGLQDTKSDTQHVYILGKWKLYRDEEGDEKYAEFMFVDDVISDDSLMKNSGEF